MILEALYNELNETEKADNDNLVTLAYRTYQELLKFNLTSDMLSLYRANGFNSIIRHCFGCGITHYDRHAIDEYVREEIAKWGGCIRAARDLRKAAHMMEEYHTTAQLVWKTMSPWQHRKPQGEFLTALDAYRQYQLKYGSVSASSIDHDCNCISRFLRAMEDSGYTGFEGISLVALSREITAHASKHTGQAIRGLLYCLRKFFKTLGEDNECKFHTTLDYSAAVPQLAAPHRYVRQGFSPEQITAILNAIPLGNAIGKRDHAIMLLSAVTGLRACDVASLKMRDIDWRQNEIKVVQSKTGRSFALPLTAEVGNAIGEYILRARPVSAAPYIFLPIHPPHRIMSSDAINDRLRKYIEAAGVVLGAKQDMGFHNFRRGLGNRLLRSETSAWMIGEVLGHRHVDSTAPYLSADTLGLRACGIPLSLIQSGGKPV